MTYEEAKELFEILEVQVPIGCGRDFQVARELAIEAIAKQIPTSVKKSWQDARGYTNTFICGKCDVHIQMAYMMNGCDYEYCPYCGNKWE